MQKLYECVMILRFVPRRVSAQGTHLYPRPLLSGELQRCKEQKSQNILCSPEELAWRSSAVMRSDGGEGIVTSNQNPNDPCLRG